MEDTEISLKQKLESLVSHSKELAETGFKLAILEATEKSSKILSNLVIVIIIFFLVNALVLFIGFGFAYWIAEAFNDQKLGFFIVGGAYLLLILLIFATRRKVIVPFFMNMIVKKIYE